MMNLLRYLPALLSLKDVTRAYEDQEGKGKPVYLRKRVVGSALTTASILTAATLNIQIDKEMVDLFVNNFNIIMESIHQIYLMIDKNVVPAILAIYGVIMAIKGKADANKRSKEDAQKAADKIVGEIRGQ